MTNKNDESEIKRLFFDLGKGIYIVGCVISGMYHGWKFIQQHGFFAWLFDKSMESSVRALIWPIDLLRYIFS